jgi:DNA-binding response OmpR family regulator
MAARVLLVEDDVLERRLWMLDLEDQGFEVMEAGSAEEAMEKLRGTRFPRPSVIVLDIGLPGRDGLSCLREIRGDAGLRSLPVVMLTAADDIDDHLHAMADGADRYLTKPAHRELLVAAVRELATASGKREA